MQSETIYSENELLQQLQNGNEAAFTNIYNRFWEKLLAIGFYYTHNKQAAEDIVHEVMMSLWIRRADIKINSLEPYLATAVKFAVFKAIARDKKQREQLLAKNIPTHFDEIESKLEARFMEEYLGESVEGLPEKARLVFIYSRQQELSIIEIADKLDLSPKAVEYHMTKALRLLRDAFKKIKILFI